MNTAPWLNPILRLLQAVTWLVLLLYPLAVWIGLTRWGTTILAPLLVTVFTLRLFVLRGKLRQQIWLGKALAVVGILLALASWALKQSHWLLYYPVLVNVLLLLLFAYSLFAPPTVVERLARMTEPQLDAAGIAYTRRVTQVWCGFFIINGAIALATCLSGDITLWTLYNGGISYLLMGALMGIEWIVRKKDPARLSLPMSQWLSAERDDALLIAWRGEQALSLGQFRRDVAALAAKLAGREERRWALCFDDSYRFAVALLASLYTARVPVIFGHQREAILKEQRTDYDALLTDLPLDPGAPILAVPEGVSAEIALPTWPQDPRFILYTSGSTGQPQAVSKSVACMDSESELLAATWIDAFQGCCVVASVSHQHMYGLSFRLFLPLAFGLPFDAQLTQYHEQLIARHQGRRLVFVSSPAWLKRLDNRLALAECVEVFSAGGPLSCEEAKRSQQALGVLPLEIYGTTETGTLAWRRQIREAVLWQPFACVVITVNADNSVNVVSPLIADTGEITLSDIIQLAPDGRQFQLNGRADRIIKLEEKRLSLSEVERRLTSLPEVTDAAVLTQQQKGRTVLVAAIVLSPYGEARRQSLSEGVFTRELRQALRNWLEPVALPRNWRIIDVIPLNPQGKRAYAELQELFL